MARERSVDAPNGSRLNQIKAETSYLEGKGEIYFPPSKAPSFPSFLPSLHTRSSQHQAPPPPLTRPHLAKSANPLFIPSYKTSPHDLPCHCALSSSPPLSQTVTNKDRNAVVVLPGRSALATLTTLIRRARRRSVPRQSRPRAFPAELGRAEPRWVSLHSTKQNVEVGHSVRRRWFLHSAKSNASKYQALLLRSNSGLSRGKLYGYLSKRGGGG